MLKISTLWSCEHIRSHVISRLKYATIDPFRRLELALECNVSEWLLVSYDTICRREDSLSATEGMLLGWDRFAAICRIREQLARGAIAPPPGSYEYLKQLSDPAVITARSAQSPDPDIVCYPAVGDFEVGIGPQLPTIPDVPRPRESLVPEVDRVSHDLPDSETVGTVETTAGPPGQGIGIKLGQPNCSSQPTQALSGDNQVANSAGIHNTASLTAKAKKKKQKDTQSSQRSILALFKELPPTDKGLGTQSFIRSGTR